VVEEREISVSNFSETHETKEWESRRECISLL